MYNFYLQGRRRAGTARSGVPHLVLSRNARSGTYCQIIRNDLHWAFRCHEI